MVVHDATEAHLKTNIAPDRNREHAPADLNWSFDLPNGLYQVVLGFCTPGLQQKPELAFVFMSCL